MSFAKYCTVHLYGDATERKDCQELLQDDKASKEWRRKFKVKDTRKAAAPVNKRRAKSQKKEKAKRFSCQKLQE